MGSSKKTAVIGAGPSGIVSLKTAKQYGYNVTCFDLQPNFGGQWRVTPEMNEREFEPMDGNEKHGLKCLNKTMIFNTSAIFTAFSDFPVEAHLDNAFWTPVEYLDYLSRYVEHFHLSDHFKFNTVVENLEKVGKKWKVHFKSVLDSQTEAECDEFDHVIIASGPFRHPTVPEFRNKEAFKGIAVHSGQVRDDELLFKNRRVTVIGFGNSGHEMVYAALNAGATKVYWSCDAKWRQQWAGDRYNLCPVLKRNKPWDMFKTRFNSFDFPEKWIDLMKATVFPVPARNTTKEQSPGEDGGCFVPVQILMEKEKEGILEKVVGVEQFYKDGLKLVDGKILENIDVVVFATGYETRYPFLDGVWGRQEQKVCELYKLVVPPEQALDGVCFVSTTFSLGPNMPLMEMQARYICEKVLTRKYDEDGHLYSESERQDLLTEIQKHREFNKKFKRPYNVQIDYATYCLNIAKEIGCNPTEPKEMFQQAESIKDVELGVAVQYGPQIEVQYRLRGPHSWDGAADFLIKTARQSLGQEFDSLVEQHMKESSKM